ncbi:MAG: hypothetical protein B7Z66_02625 [Chromatiales bacterium 21-64-14]|nr:MAG: hypothetical protein B7Z66_02625 [Chromatiales bacterium 21-64-14]HQU14517.1 thioredoxin family protein [Gammaproteobacteria bacterium]
MISKRKTRAFGVCLALLLAAWGPLAVAAPPTVREPHDFQALGREAAAGRMPIVLEFAASDCRYCRILEHRVLNPMLLSKEYTGKILIRKVEIDSGATILDFQGHPLPVADLARRYGIRFTPVVVFLDSAGRELAPRLVGLSSLDFYGAYLDTAIETARKRLSEDLASRATVPAPQP